MSQGTPEQQVVALLQRGDLRGAHQLLLALQQHRPDDAALRTRTQQVEALIQQRLQAGLPVGPTQPMPMPPAAPAPAPVHAAAPAQPYDQQTLAALQAQVLAEPVRYAYAYLQAGRLGESLQLLRIALAREPGNLQVRDLALYVARQIQQQQQAQTYAAPPAPVYSPPAPPQYAPPAPPPSYAGARPPAPAAGPPPPPASTPNPFSPPPGPGPFSPPPAPVRAPPPAPTAGPVPRYPQDAITHQTGEMPAFALEANPTLSAAAALPPRSQVPPSAPPPPPAAPAPRYPLDARTSESMEMPIDQLGLPLRPSAPPYEAHSVPASRSPPAPSSIPPPALSSASISVPADEPRPDPNEVVRATREMIRSAAKLEAAAPVSQVSAPPPAPNASAELAIDIDEPLEDVPVDFDEVPEAEDEGPPPALGQWPGPQWVDRSIPSAPAPVLRTAPPLPLRSAPPPASRPPAAHRWDADSSSPEQDAFSLQDEPMPVWKETPPPAAPVPPPTEDPLVKEARARAERMQQAFERYSRRESVPAPLAAAPPPVSAPPPKASEPPRTPSWAAAPVDYSEGLGADLLAASDAATEIATPSELSAFDDEPLDEAYDFEPAPPSIPPASARENPPAPAQFALADPGPGFVSAPPSAPMSEEVMQLEALLDRIRERRRSPSRHLVSA